MTKFEFYDAAGRWAKAGVVYIGEGVNQIIKNPSEHLSLVGGYLSIGLATFLLLALGGHRATRQGPTIAAATILAWPIPWVGVFLHSIWNALTYFLWQMWRGD